MLAYLNSNLFSNKHIFKEKLHLHITPNKEVSVLISIL